MFSAKKISGVEQRGLRATAIDQSQRPSHYGISKLFGAE
jgi:hypothetical protein